MNHLSSSNDPQITLYLPDDGGEVMLGKYGKIPRKGDLFRVDRGEWYLVEEVQWDMRTEDDFLGVTGQVYLMLGHCDEEG